MKIDLTFAEPTSNGSAFAAADVDSAKRKLTGVAVPFGVPSGPASDGYRYEFSGPPSNIDELVDVVDEHDAKAVAGRLAEPFAADKSHLLASARLFSTTRGNDLLTEAVEGVKTGFSVGAGFDKFTERPDGVRVVDDWTALHLGVVRRPAFTEAAGLTLAASAQDGDTVTTTTDTTAQADAAAAAALAAQDKGKQGGAQIVELPTIAELAAQVRVELDKAAKTGTHPLARFKTADDFYAAFQSADEPGRVALAVEFALVDQITTNNPGVMPPGWRTDIKANLDKRRPAITATGGPIGLPDAGMDANWPYFDGDLDALIEKQITEKTELHSARIDIKKGNAPILSAGVASDISYQLLMRSSPSYLAAHNAICEAAWARYTEAVFELALYEAGTYVGALPADLTNAAGAQALRTLLFTASAAVEDATGAPATVVLAADDVWISVGANPALVPQTSSPGTPNAGGTADAASLEVNVSNLKIDRAPFLPAGTLVVLNGFAARFPEQGPMVATEEDVAKLGRNVAVWGMYEEAEVYFPAGIRVYGVDPDAP
jgi:hypothetical protein